MKINILMLLLTAATLYSRSQEKYPRYNLAVSIEYSYVPGIFLYGAFYPDNLEFTGRISQKVCLQGGIFAQSGDQVPGESFFEDGFAIYIGGTMKFFLFKNCYFTPAANVYVDVYKNTVLDDWSITIGPTLAFEYFFSDRFSLRLDVINVNIGIGFPNTDLIGTLHRLAGVGVKYNFNLNVK